MGILRKKQHKRTGKPTYRTRRVASKGELDNSSSVFRRNRTLTGSLSSHVSSANENQSELRSGRVQVHHLRRYRRRLFLILIAVAFVSLGIFWLIWQSIIDIKIEVADGASMPLDSKQYQDGIRSYFEANPLRMSRVSIDTKKLTNYLQDNGYPEIANVQLAERGSRIGLAVFDVTMRKPVVSWKTGSTELYVDSRGVAFKRNFYNQHVVEVVDQTGIEAVNNQVLASNRFLSFIGLVVGHLKSYDFIASKVELPANTTHQVVVWMEQVPYPVKFDTDRPPAEQVEDATQAIKYLSNKAIAPSYVDVRVSGRAYYK